MADIRHKIADSLRAEMERKELAEHDLAELAHLSAGIVSEYLRGEREPQFGELNPLCRVLGTDLLWLLSAGFKPSKLVYRKIGRQARERASVIENAFILVFESIPKAIHPLIDNVPEADQDALMVLLELDKQVTALRGEHPTVEALYKAHRLPVLGVAAEDDFDGFLLTIGKKSLVCVNTNRPNVRLENTLLHEFAHFAFDSDRDLPVDVEFVPADFYKQRIPNEVRTEYIATKFAQLFLAPLDAARKWAEAVEPEVLAAEYVQAHGVSPDVVANALYDALWMSNQKRNYAPLRDAIKDRIPHYEGRREVRNFVQESTHQLHQAVMELREEFGEGRWQQIREAWGFGNAE